MTNLTLFAVSGKAENLGVLPDQPALSRGAFAIAKRVTDVALGAVALLLFLPLMTICAMLIKLFSSGPIFYRQDRCGKDGKVFRMYKLRTMSPDAESETGPVWADDDDPRVVPCCRWMRRSHVDELPQIVNVLLGQMSLVGPRPERPDILADLTRSYPKTPQRLAVLPGITGLAQIRWKYDNVRESFNHKLKIDLEYIQKRSWMYDLYIILATIPKFVSISAPENFAPVVRPAATACRARRGEFQGFARQQIPRSIPTKKCG